MAALPWDDYVVSIEVDETAECVQPCRNFRSTKQEAGSHRKY